MRSAKNFRATTSPSLEKDQLNWQYTRSHFPNPMYEFQPRQRPLPTMYDLPSEEVGDPGLPDEFHRFQAELLTETCQSPCYPGDRCFTASDLNL